ncbi:hypothetical protein EDB83DRAFT_251521 [Lactarius deliciosus]|nr:hypothetical protein EDB83DRAFT_251521 [Lactarius deliciosus]
MAWRRRCTLWSHQGPFSESNASRIKRKRSPLPPKPPVANYFPASCQHTFGPLPIPPTDTFHPDGANHKFLHNITFRRADWVNECTKLTTTSSLRSQYLSGSIWTVAMQA